MREYRTLFLCSIVSLFSCLHAIQHSKLPASTVTRHNTAHVIDIAHQFGTQDILCSLILSSDGKHIIKQDNQLIQHHSYGNGIVTPVGEQKISLHDQLRLQQVHSQGTLSSTRTYRTPHYSVSVNSLRNQVSIKGNNHGCDQHINPPLEEGSHCACTEVDGRLIIAHYYPSHNKVYLTDITANKYWKRGMRLQKEETLIQIAFTRSSNTKSCSLAALIASQNKLKIEQLNCHFNGKTLSTEPRSQKIICSIDEMYEDDTHAPGMAFNTEGTHGAVVNRIARAIKQFNPTCKQVRLIPQTIYSVHTFNCNFPSNTYYSHECRVAKQLSNIAISSLQISDDGTKVLCDGLLFDMTPEKK